MRDFSVQMKDLARRVQEASVYLQVDDARLEVAELETQAADPTLWDDQDRARGVTSRLSSLKSDVDVVEQLQASLSDMQTLYELMREAGDESIESEIDQLSGTLTKQLDQLELRSLFTGEYDERDAICSINSGAGGTEACDWAEMLFRMYSRWCERNEFTLVVTDLSPGEEVGISSVSFTVKGRHAYGLLTGEKGVHRLVRISPFDSQSRRHTSFASFEIVPALEVEELPEIDESELRVDTYRASGAGGQHVNKTDSAIRLTHLPTGIVVQCQNERSQLQNRAQAMAILSARLAEKQRVDRAAELAKISGNKMEVGWGSQIRSYVLAPYQLVRDERTKMIDGHEQPIYETGNVVNVLDGDIDNFLSAFLQWRRSQS
ncbi:MAG TPA: peptide chain release factor 2 [Acidimicrobiia bacterium]|nr:peptide chain release factor 2 [Acidimicrobiia bacterium]